MSGINRRRRSAVAVSAVAGVALSTAAVLAPSASSAPPTGDCATPFPVSDLVDGQEVTGLTVQKGTTPEGFDGEVLGVLEDGIAPGLDMVMVRLTSPEIDRVGGIWQGMSGSPVYADDGRLIGAVAYGMTWGTSPVAGVTPFEEMDDYLAPRAAARKVDLSSAEARELASEPGVSQQEAQGGFEQLRMPVNVSGVAAKRLDADMKDRPYLGGRARRAASGSGGSTAGGVEDLVAGGNLAASVMHGDILAGGVATVTSLCNDEVIGFGHPFMFSGRTTMGLHPASAIYIQENPVGAPFKVANIGPVVGTVDEDRATGLSGKIGAGPATIDIASDVSYKTRNRAGESHVSLPDWAPSGVLYQLWANQDRVFDAWAKGGAVQNWTIQGTGPDGTPFTLEDGDRYVSDWDISYETPWDIADVIWEISEIQGAEISSVEVDAAMKDSAKTWAIDEIQQKKAGAWTTVGRRITARGGKDLKLRAVLTDGKDERTVFWKVRVPKKLIGGYAELEVLGGGSDYYWGGGGTPSLEKILNRASNGLRNDELRWRLVGNGNGGSARRTHVNPPKQRVIEGYKYLNVNVRG